MQVVFAQNSNRGHIYDVEGYDDAPAKGLVKVQCFPLYSYLLALNITTVDYFSLDVEGAEYKVLLTIPWEKVDIRVSVDYFLKKVYIWVPKCLIAFRKRIYLGS